MLKFEDCISAFNVTAYPDITYDASGKELHLVILDRFAETGEEEDWEWIGKKVLYFSDYAYYNMVLNEDNIEALWDLPEYSKVVGNRVIWLTTN